jgi:hypothetical protein
MIKIKKEMEMEITRRKMMSSVAIGGAAFSLASCAGTPAPIITNPTNGNLEINPMFVTEVTNLLISTCSIGSAFIPTAVTIANVVAGLFGPAAVATVQFISGAVAATASEICSASPATPVAAMKLRGRLRLSSPLHPVYIGTTQTVHVVVQGYAYRS